MSFTGKLVVQLRIMSVYYQKLQQYSQMSFCTVNDDSDYRYNNYHNYLLLSAGCNQVNHVGRLDLIHWSCPFADYSVIIAYIRKCSRRATQYTVWSLLMTDLMTWSVHWSENYIYFVSVVTALQWLSTRMLLNVVSRLQFSQSSPTSCWQMLSDGLQLTSCYLLISGCMYQNIMNISWYDGTSDNKFTLNTYLV